MTPDFIKKHLSYPTYYVNHNLTFISLFNMNLRRIIEMTNIKYVATDRASNYIYFSRGKYFALIVDRLQNDVYKY